MLFRSHLLIADSPETFKDAVVKLVDNPLLARQLGRAGRVLYELEYTWPSAWEKLDFAESLSGK